ncbi:hypothetical protein PCASD_19591 [Puccinia coronata f. sp. avenae]|uniref:Integrase core domain-containing protein n=1 Tax=Puccinia coronata f. sp. avenae TaxID=200324 RepID=A0A2N5TSD0_9BASI|nr:hypothetical protein PCASD_19591 [Puccinia coronata f. sp. avenae]
MEMTYQQETSPTISSHSNDNQPLISHQDTSEESDLDTLESKSNTDSSNNNSKTNNPDHSHTDSDSDSDSNSDSDSDADSDSSSDSGSDVLTSDDSERSGSDDEKSITSFGPDSEGSADETPELNLSPQDKRLQYLVSSLISLGYKGPAIIKTLYEKHGIQISPRNLTRKRKEWALRQCDLQKSPPPPPLSPPVQASVLSSHAKGMNLKEIQARLTQETGVDVTIRTVQLYLRKLNLKLLPNDLSDGRITMEKVFEAINNARDCLLQHNTGYRRMRIILIRQYNIRIPRQIIYNVLKEIDPEGMSQRLRMFVHVTNNDPQHIGLYFLHLVSKVGGIPLKVTSDYGTETVEMAVHQMSLSHIYAGISKEEAEKRMHFTKSTHNQKIEALWSQMMKQHNRSIKHNIMTEIENGTYDPDDHTQKLLFQFLWIPVFQASVDIWVNGYNHYQKRYDKLTTLPTGVTPEFAYTTPEYFHTTNQLVPIPSADTDALLQQKYPDSQNMFAHTPTDFHELATSVMAHLGLDFSNIDLGNVWEAFRLMLPHIEEEYVFNTQSPQESSEESFQASGHNSENDY